MWNQPGTYFTKFAAWDDSPHFDTFTNQNKRQKCKDHSAISHLWTVIFIHAHAMLILLFLMIVFGVSGRVKHLRAHSWKNVSMQKDPQWLKTDDDMSG